MSDNLFPRPLGEPRPPTDEEKTKLLLYLWKLQYGTLEGLTEEQRVQARASVEMARIAVFDVIKAYDVYKKDGRLERSSIMFVFWVDKYEPGKPYYYDVFAWWKGKELQQLSPTSGYIQLIEYLDEIVMPIFRRPSKQEQ
jgi:hypothetical protein